MTHCGIPDWFTFDATQRNKESNVRGLRANCSVSVFVLLCMVLARVPDAAIAQPAIKGKWEPPFEWPNVAVHLHMLPTGNVLFYSRRELGENLDPRDCVPRVWNPTTGLFTRTPSPGFNLFCSGHTFLADGRLFVMGGHITDNHGEPRATIYDATDNTWTEIDRMPRDPNIPGKGAGRWYPTAVTLPNGDVLVSSGSNENGIRNVHQLVWSVTSGWRTIVSHNDIPLYPRMHVAPTGQVFLSGPLKLTQMLDTNGGGSWQVVGNSAGPVREDGCSVLYEEGKVLIVGGGRPPLKTAQTIDLNAASPTWTDAAPMTFARRHHNATLLPDGTVLVTGGTQGNNGAGTNGFNDVRPGMPVHTPELWDPHNGPGGSWTQLADEQIDRCYHSTAVLLPDARVLSAGGGEWRPDDTNPNNALDSHTDAQIFSPPYLFKSTAANPRPDITGAPDEVQYGATFAVGTSHPAQVRKVNLLRLTSVTHQCNLNQRICSATFDVTATGLTVTAPDNPNTCPPGHYMMFVLNDDGVPSVAKIIRVHP